MSLLSLCQQVAAVVPVAVPDTIVGNIDNTATLLLALAQDAGEWLARQPSGGWVNLIREYEFQTAARGPYSGAIANTGANGVAQITGLSSTAGITAGWYATGNGIPNNTLVQSNDGPSQLTLNKAASQSGAGEFTFGQSDYALPSDFRWVIDGTLWDRSRFWALRGPLSPQEWQLYKSSVIGKASIQRRFRFRYKNGAPVFSIDPCPTDSGAYLVFEYMSNAWCRSAIGTPQTTWQADTDVALIDEYLVRLALRWRILNRTGLAYQQELDECEREVAKAIARDGGQKILNLSPTDGMPLIGPWNVPEGNFGNMVS